jgi:hypothetical protein
MTGLVRAPQPLFHRLRKGANARERGEIKRESFDAFRSSSARTNDHPHIGLSRELPERLRAQPAHGSRHDNDVGWLGFTPGAGCVHEVRFLHAQACEQREATAGRRDWSELSTTKTRGTQRIEGWLWKSKKKRTNLS